MYLFDQMWKKIAFVVCFYFVFYVGTYNNTIYTIYIYISTKNQLEKFYHEADTGGADLVTEISHRLPTTLQ